MGNFLKKMSKSENKPEKSENKPEYEKMKYSERSNLLYSAIRDQDFELVKEICVGVQIQVSVLNFDEFSIDKYHVYNAIHSRNTEIAKFLFDKCELKDHYFILYCIQTVVIGQFGPKKITINKELLRYFLNRESYYKGTLQDFEKCFDIILSEYNELILEKLEVLSMFIIPDISKIILEYAIQKL